MSDSETARIQGTDGVRGLVKPAERFPDDSPVETFLERGVMTEEFFELYCFAYVSDLIKREEMEPGREILVGWDPRDREGFYTSRAISGVSKAGGRPVMLGILPTPGLPLLLVNRRAGGAIMITASHNPADQNGIKIFNAPKGMKLLPEDDVRLTAKILDTDYEKIKKAVGKYEPLNIEKNARKVFMDFHMDKRNSWIPEQERPFANTTLIADPANGALSGISAEFFNEAGFREVIEVAGDPDGRVNENSGVALLEGVKEINAKQLEQEPAIARHELVKRMFEEGRRLKKSSAKDETMPLLGATFDADGDRFYILAYSAEKDCIYVLSGDETAALQAGYLSRVKPERWRGATFVHTIESDINVARHAASLGFKPLLTPVGDKWILQKALDESETFGIGCEESGHCISGGVAIIGGVAPPSGGEVEFFAGNGLKGAVNTLVSMLASGKRESAEEFAQRVKNPFEPGFRQSAYSYYVDKKLFGRNGKIWQGVERVIHETFNVNTRPEFSLENVEMENDPDTLFLKITRGDNEFSGTVFIRNSGTEDKISVNVRGARELENLLLEINREVALFLMRNMKDKTNPMAVAEATALKRLYRGDTLDPGFFSTIDFERLIFEMETKQKLIKRKKSGFALTLPGRYLVDW